MKADFRARAKANDVPLRVSSDLRRKRLLREGPWKGQFFSARMERSSQGEGKVVRRGRSIGYVECEITDERGQLVAKAASTCLALRGEDAKER